MPRGGHRDGAGRKPKPDPALLTGEPRKPGPLSGAQRECYAKILEALNAPELKDKAAQEKVLEGEPREVKRFRLLVDAIFDPKADIAARRLSFETLKYLYDKRDGKAIQPVDVDASLDGVVNIFQGTLGALRASRH